jgi:hypothetical protein
LKIAGENSEALLVDSHVHYYQCYSLPVFLDSALSNFERAGLELGLSSRGIGCLVLAETPEQAFFQQLREASRRHLPERWRFFSTDEGCSLIAQRDQGEELIVIAGRQIATLEGLEVLALGCSERFPTGLSLGEAVDAAHSSGAITVVPWGFAKWWFRRGKLVGDLLETLSAKRGYLGDSAVRPQASPRPRLYELAASNGIWTLAGTDPLPFPAEMTKPGTYGFALQAEFDRRRPAASLKKSLNGQRTQPRIYGRRASLPVFLRAQLSMQVRRFA